MSDVTARLCSKTDVTERLRLDGSDVVAIENPMSESYAAYPHRVFEVGEAVVRDLDENHLSPTDPLHRRRGDHSLDRSSKRCAILVS